MWLLYVKPELRYLSQDKIVNDKIKCRESVNLIDENKIVIEKNSDKYFESIVDMKRTLCYNK